jgi:hypothetical protein
LSASGGIIYSRPHLPPFFFAFSRHRRVTSLGPRVTKLPPPPLYPVRNKPPLGRSGYDCLPSGGFLTGAHPLIVACDTSHHFFSAVANPRTHSAPDRDGWQSASSPYSYQEDLSTRPVGFDRSNISQDSRSYVLCCVLSEKWSKSFRIYGTSYMLRLAHSVTF